MQRRMRCLDGCRVDRAKRRAKVNPSFCPANRAKRGSQSVKNKCPIRQKYFSRYTKWLTSRESRRPWHGAEGDPGPRIAREEAHGAPKRIFLARRGKKAAEGQAHVHGLDEPNGVPGRSPGCAGGPGGAARPRKVKTGSHCPLEKGNTPRSPVSAYRPHLAQPSGRHEIERKKQLRLHNRKETTEPFSKKFR